MFRYFLGAFTYEIEKLEFEIRMIESVYLLNYKEK